MCLHKSKSEAQEAVLHASRLVSDMRFFLIRPKRPYILIPNCGERDWVSRRLGFPIGKLIASARLLMPV